MHFNYTPTHVIYYEDNTDPKFPFRKLVNTFPSITAARHLLALILTQHRIEAYPSGDEVRVMQYDRVIKKWVIADIKTANELLPSAVQQMKWLVGVWSVTSFGVRGQYTDTKKWEAFKINTDGVVETKYISKGNWVKGQTLELNAQSEGVIVMNNTGKLKWVILEVTEDTLVLENDLKNLIYKCKRIKEKGQ